MTQVHPPDPDEQDIIAGMRLHVIDPMFEEVQQLGPPRSHVLPEVVLAKRNQRARQRLAEALASLETMSVPAHFFSRIKELIHRWAAVDFNDGFQDVGDFEVECAEESELIKAKNSGDPKQLLFVHEKRYRRAILKTHGFIELKGLQMSARIYQDLHEVYVPLYVGDLNAIVVEKIENEEKIQKIRKLIATDVVHHSKRVVIVGAPGSGKSVLISFLASSAAVGHFDAWDLPPIPFVVPVRSLDEKQILNEDTIATRSGCEPNLLRGMLTNGRALILIDGLDEIGGANATSARMQALLNSISKLGNTYPKIRIVVTTRPRSVLKNAAQLREFTKTNLLPMEREEVYVFIDRWCLAAEKSVQKDANSALDTARRIAADLKQRVASSRAIEKLAETPLMASVVCIVHRFLGGNVPERRTALYDACTNVLLYEWDRSKFPEGSSIGALGAAEKRVLLAGVARTMHDRGWAELPRIHVQRQIAERLKLVTTKGKIANLAAEAQRIVDEIRDRSGILVERRPGYFAFSHHTFQEYLTAFDYVREKKYDELIKSYKDEWWHEVIALAAGLPGTDAQAIIVGLDHAGKQESQRSKTALMLAAHCAETAIELPIRLREKIEERIGKLIPPCNLEEADTCVSFGTIAGPILLRRLHDATPDQQVWSIVAVMRLEFEPAISLLVRKLLDDTPMPQPLLVRGFLLHAQTPLRVLASFALYEMSFSSKLCRELLERAIPSATHDVVHFLRRMTDTRLFNNPPEHIIRLNMLTAGID